MPSSRSVLLLFIMFALNEKAQKVTPTYLITLSRAMLKKHKHNGVWSASTQLHDRDNPCANDHVSIVQVESELSPGLWNTATGGRVLLPKDENGSSLPLLLFPTSFFIRYFCWVWKGLTKTEGNGHHWTGIGKRKGNIIYRSNQPKMMCGEGVATNSQF